MGFCLFLFFLTKESDFLHTGQTSIPDSLAIEYMSPSLKNRIGQCYRDSVSHDLGMLSKPELVFPVARTTTYFLGVRLRTFSDLFFRAYFRNF